MANETIKKFSIPLVAYFIASIILIAISFPREGKFKYSFNEGKPWKYGLLTAPFDITIYKTDAQVEAEKDSIKNNNRPFFYSFDNNITAKAKNNILQYEQTQGKAKNIPPSYFTYLNKQLDYIYTVGVISSSDYEKIAKTQSQELRIKTNNVAVTRPVNTFFTIKSAYELIVKDCPPNLDSNVLKRLDISSYLQENVIYNKELSEKALNEYLSKVMISVGIVQAGEKIVDRGEIIDSQTYRVLTSLQKQTQARTGSRQYQAMLLLGEIILITIFLAIFYSYLY